MRRTELFTVPKYFEWRKPQITVDISKDGADTCLLVKSNCFAKNVELDFEHNDISLSDNYFDITEKGEYLIRCTTDLSAEELKKDLTIKTVYDIR